jgi:EAL domain-containing protein (putative c-di-GMP-specific phosphodiesterase class I)
MVELELTESIAMDDSTFTIDMVARLHALGIGLSIDDFGTGYSSLSYLKRFKIDKLKIDQSFIRDLHSDPDDEAIVTAIIGLAKGLGFRTIAEGVETQEQLDFLRAHQCDEIQGYFYSKPVPADEFARLLAHQAGKKPSIDR